MRSPKVSIVIPAYNEATYIDRLLKALTKQNFKDFEVIVSDAQSNDGTEKVINEFKKKLDIKLVLSPPKGPAHGRNIGASKAKGEWLLFLDADNDIKDSNFIRILHDQTINRKWKTSAGRYKVIDPTFMEKIGMEIINFQYLKFLSHTKKPVAMGHCIFTNRLLFNQLGGFNEKIQFGEDYDYVNRAAKEGFGYVDDAIYFIDMRRAREEGGLRLFWKGLLNEVYRFLPGYNLEKNPVTYEFGKHAKRQK